MNRFLLLAICGLLPLAAQPNLLPMEDFIQDWKNSKKLTIEVAEKMPEEFYSYRPAPEVSTFHALLAHIATSQAFRFAQIKGETLPLKLPKEQTKQTVISLLNDSFDYVLSVLPKLTEEQLSKTYKVDWRERPTATGRQILLNMFVHTAHHRAQCETYMRSKGVEPPYYLF